MMKRVVVVNRDVLVNSADYRMIINLTRVGSLTTSSAGITACLQLALHLPGWMSVCRW